LNRQKNKIEEYKKSFKSKFQKDLERYTKDKPQWPRCERINIMEDAEFVGESIPFYYGSKKDDKETSFNPKKDYTWKRAPAWSFKNKNPMKLPTEQMENREQNIKDKIENLKSQKNITDKMLEINVMESYDKVKNRGKCYHLLRKPFDYANTEQYKSCNEQHPKFTPGPSHYWKMKELDTNSLPKVLTEDKEVNGKNTKIYYMNRKRTDFRVHKPMRSSVF